MRATCAPRARPCFSARQSALLRQWIAEALQPGRERDDARNSGERPNWKKLRQLEETSQADGDLDGFDGKAVGVMRLMKEKWTVKENMVETALSKSKLPLISRVEQLR